MLCTKRGLALQVKDLTGSPFKFLCNNSFHKADIVLFNHIALWWTFSCSQENREHRSGMEGKARSDYRMCIAFPGWLSWETSYLLVNTLILCHQFISVPTSSSCETPSKVCLLCCNTWKVIPKNIHLALGRNWSARPILSLFMATRIFFPCKAENWKFAGPSKHSDCSKIKLMSSLDTSWFEQYRVSNKGDLLCLT